jgi:hydrogenase-4 component B
MSTMYSGSLAPFAVLMWPLLIGLVPIIPSWRVNALRLLPFAPLPAIGFALAGAPESVVIPDLMLGVQLGATPVTALLLGMTGLVWSVAGYYAALTMVRANASGIFAGFWCLTLAGNLGVFLANDIITFYIAFAAVSLAAWFMVVHDRTRDALAAGRVYIILAVLGEAALLSGLMIGAAAAEDLQIASVRAAFADAPLGSLGVGLLIAGFGIKAGMVPLHIWLPLAHPAAPVAGSAVLSGAIVKAGLIGMVLLVPEETGSRSVLIVLGLLGAFGAAIWGMSQRDPKAVLAYSTVSQMGIMLVLVGAGSQGVGYYALHHGMAKAALFLCVGMMILATSAVKRRAALGLALVVALSVAGLPLTGGALAKLAGKLEIGEMLALAITLSSVTTTLVLGWFLIRLQQIKGKPQQTTAWGLGFGAVMALAVLALVLPWVLWPGAVNVPRDYAWHPSNILEGLWPVLVGLGGLALVHRLQLPAYPPGDLLHLFSKHKLRPAFQLPVGNHGARRTKRPILRLLLKVKDAERALLHWPVAGSTLIGLALVLAAMVWIAN